VSSAAQRRALVIVPTYNERENIERLIASVLAVSNGIDLLVVDDNSPDGTGEIVDRLVAERPERVSILHRPEKEGIGPAYLAGFRIALERDVPVIVTMDADFSHDPDDLPRLLDALDESDIALGSRYVTGGGTVGWPLHRRLISRWGGMYAQLVLGVHVRDLTGGFKAYRRPVIQMLVSEGVRSDGYGFQIETVYRALKHGFRVAEAPIVFHDRTLGRSKLSRRIVLEAMLMVWRLRFERHAKPRGIVARP
jgi:dolichol-phosphate mannosyltransferase